MNSSAIHKQIFWFSLINYVGVAIGMVSTLFIYPNNQQFLGEIRFVESIAQLLFPLFLLGLPNALVNFYPLLKTDTQPQLFGYAIIRILYVFLLVGLVLGLVHSFFNISKFEYYIPAYILAFALAYIELFKKKSAIIQKIEVPTLLEKVMPKLLLPSLFIYLFYTKISTEKLWYVYSFVFVGLAFFTYFYIVKTVQPTFKKNNKNVFEHFTKAEFYRFSFYAFAGSLGSFLAFRIDSFMLGNFNSMEAVGSYNIAVLLTSVIAIPATGLFATHAPIISELLKNNQLKELGTKYTETSKFLFFIGALAMGCLVLGITDLFSLLPTADKLLPIIPVVYLLGFNVLINMATGFNSEIITFSKYYRFNIYTVYVLVGLNILLTYYFLTQTTLGTVGVAIASLVSLVVFNASKLIFIYQKFNLQPFDKSYIKLIFLVVFLVLFFYLLPSFENHWLNILVKCGLFVGSSLFLVIKLRWIYALQKFAKWLKV